MSEVRVGRGLRGLEGMERSKEPATNLAGDLGTGCLMSAGALCGVRGGVGWGGVGRMRKGERRGKKKR